MDLVFYFHIGRSGVGSAPLFDICQDLCTHVSQRLFIHRFSAHSFLVHRWMYLTTSFLTGHPICKNLRRTHCLDCMCNVTAAYDTRKSQPTSSRARLRLWLNPKFQPTVPTKRHHSNGLTPPQTSESLTAHTLQHNRLNTVVPLPRLGEHGRTTYLLL